MTGSQRPAGDEIRIVLIDDHALFREALARLLSDEPDLRIVAKCSSVDQARPVLEAAEADLVLLDLDLGSQRGDSLLEVARGDAGREGYAGRILILAAVVRDGEVPDLIRRGAAGIFLKEEPPELLPRAIRRVVGGELWLRQHHLQLLVAALRRPKQEAPGAFTERERQVLRYVLEGLVNKQIAQRLGVTESSVKATMQQLFRKTGVHTRSQLVRIALEDLRGRT
jgi:DNA-binding NarL/FixJ family response regulator